MRYLLPLIFFTLCSCSADKQAEKVPATDTIPPVMKLMGLEIDTTYLNTTYKDRGVSLLDEVNGELRCMDEGVQVKTTGYVDTRIAGSYTLGYTGFDNAGNTAGPLTRTVHVVPNSTSFLSGDYYVTYTCTAYTRGIESSTLTSGNYRATVIPGTQDHYFEIASVNTGPMFKVPHHSFLNGNKIELDYWDADFQKTDASGSVSPTKNSFTIQTTTFMYDHVYYKCTNVYTKLVVIR